MKRVVIADDLTGASDAGLQFANRGLRTTVWLDCEANLREFGGDVIVFDTDSRAASPDDARQRMQSLLACLQPLTPSRIVKKMDSTLRGNLGAELRALMDALPDATVVVCPAFPKQGRVCRDGMVFVHGVRVDQSDFARDPLSPVHDARVAALFEAPAALLTLFALRAGAANVNAEIEHARTQGIRIAIADAETDDDLRTLAALTALRDDIIWVGSAGLLEYLAAQCNPDSQCRNDAQSHPAPQCHNEPHCHPELVEGCATIVPTANGPVAFIVGSRTDMTQRQIATFGAQRGSHTELIHAGDLIENSAAVARKAAAAADALRRGLDTLIAVEGDSPDDAHGASRRIRERLVAMVDESLRSDSGATVVLSGGDVARAFCEHRGIRGLELIAEVAPGIPIARAIGANLFVVTKAGGFGQANTYVDIAAALHAKAPT